MFEKVKETARFLESRLSSSPEIGMITGTGLGAVTERITQGFRLSYGEIPNFPVSTVEGHRGVLAAGTLSGRSILAMEGRFHLYEGYSPWEVTFPVRVMAELGVKYLFMSSAAGGLNPRFQRGDLMVITDHINLKGVNPLRGIDPGPSLPRFPDMSRVYSPDLINLARQTAIQKGVLIREGVYVGVPGPSLETPAETRLLRMIGADAVGMSTVSQSIVGVQCGLEILGIVVITNVNLPDCMGKTSVDDIIAAARGASPVLSGLWQGIVEKLPE